MIQELKRVGPMRAAKVGAIIYGSMLTIVGLVIVPFGIMGIGLRPSGTAPQVGASSGILLLVAYPIVGGFFGWIIGFVSSTIYNLVSRWTGGLILDFDDSDAGSSSGPA